MKAARLTFASQCVIATFPLFPCAAASSDCAPCHREIYDRYRQTPMANSSGSAGSGLIHESYDHAAFDHAPTGFHYRLSAKPGAILLEFATRDGSM